MKVLYLDCSMGAAGDMLTAALCQLTDADAFVEEINSIGLHGVEVEKSVSSKCGINGLHIDVKINGEEEHEGMHHHHEEHHHHNSMHGIEHIVSHLNISDKVKNDVISVYNIIAQAESEVHGVTVDEIHFHEVGTMDAVCDVTAVCMLMEKINPDKVIASAVNTGSGQVKCAHGILPVPAPATANILRGIPSYSGTVKSELCTPTGAALLKYFVSSFGDMPVMRTEKIGYGMGKKDFEVANCVRAFLGEDDKKSDTVTELKFNVDDMTGEELAYAQKKLLQAGALDVFTVSVGTKKSRQGMLITVLCKEKDKQEIVELIFKHTSTIGVRETVCNRYVLDRKIKTVETPLGKVNVKASSGYSTEKCKYEFDDLERLADENNLSLKEVKRLLNN